MTNQKDLRVLLVLYLAINIIISACSPTSSLRIGWACFNRLQAVECSYREFSGREVRAARLDAGSTVEVQFDITVDSGKLTFSIEDPNGDEIVSMELTESLKDVYTFTTVKDGRYSFVVEGQETEGAFHLEWKDAN